MRRIIGRYALHAEVARGGMATVHLGRLLGPAGFSRTVAIKRLHEQFAKDPEIVSMFFDEARLAARIRHRNVVSVLDVVAISGELFLVMDYVEGESLARLIRRGTRRGERIDLRIISAMVVDALRGLHAAHEARDAHGSPLNIVHRDVSPQNILVATDGTARMVDFGVAKARGRLQTTSHGELKGKFAYMSPEQLRLQCVDRRTDIYAAAVVLWEALTGRRLWRGEAGQVIAQIMTHAVKPPSALRPDVTAALDRIALRGLERDPRARFRTAKEMADAIEAAIPPAPASAVAAWVNSIAGEALRERARKLEAVEQSNPAFSPESHRREMMASLYPTSEDVDSDIVEIDPDELESVVEHTSDPTVEHTSDPTVGSTAQPTPDVARFSSRWRRPISIGAAAAALLVSVATVGWLWRDGGPTAIGVKAPALRTAGVAVVGGARSEVASPRAEATADAPSSFAPPGEELPQPSWPVAKLPVKTQQDTPKKQRKSENAFDIDWK